MEIFLLDKENVKDFSFLLTPEAVQAISSESRAQGFVVKEENRHVGALAGHFTGLYSYELLSVYVLPEYRRRGVGRLLLTTLDDALKGTGANIHIGFTKLNDDLKGLDAFFDAAGYDEIYDEESTVYALSLSTVGGLKMPAPSKSAECQAFSDIPSYIFKNFTTQKPGGFVPIPAGGFFDQGVDRELSMGIIKDYKLAGYAVVKTIGEDAIMLTSVYMGRACTKDALGRLLGSVWDRAKKRYGADVKLLIPTVNEKAKSFIENKFEEDNLEQVYVQYEHLTPTASPNYANMPLSDFLATEREYVYGDEEEGAYVTQVEGMFAW